MGVNADYLSTKLWSCKFFKSILLLLSCFVITHWEICLYKICSILLKSSIMLFFLDPWVLITRALRLIRLIRVVVAIAVWLLAIALVVVVVSAIAVIATSVVLILVSLSVVGLHGLLLLSTHRMWTGRLKPVQLMLLIDDHHGRVPSLLSQLSQCLDDTDEAVRI